MFTDLFQCVHVSLQAAVLCKCPKLNVYYISYKLRHILMSKDYEECWKYFDNSVTWGNVLEFPGAMISDSWWKASVRDLEALLQPP